MNERLHNDGDYTIFKVQVQLKYSGRLCWQSWESLYSYFTDKRFPDSMRYGSSTKRPRRELEPFRSFTACGECWQRTGIHGTFDEQLALQLATLILKVYNVPVRVVRMTISQHTSVSATFRRRAA